ncbi:uncharacterized protein LOC129582480 [Paramacrobiotus metropolitanus]|uniref:uncharacterized protein LOC129582480 n=1 Tax=Paramacrobiotus metropolitanus TaxID=2943436 RepID=UPI0024460666|nr:uncharacterized protein LOC129582480 [Paramacrobiotus metropolitanus]
MMYNLFVSHLHTVLFTYSAVVFLSWKLVSTSPPNKTDTSVPHLERYCNTEPLIINNGRYGSSFILSDYLEQFCTVTLMIVTPSAITGTCSVYFNIAESTMPENDELKVYQHGSGSLLKVIRNDVDNSVASVGQFQTTDFRHNITLTLNLIRQKDTINRSHQIKFQYTLVIYQPVGIYSKSWIRCRALRGYVLRRLACDGKINRFTCPIELNTAVNGNNAVKYHDVRACTEVFDTEPHRDDFNDDEIWRNTWSVRNHFKKRTDYTILTGHHDVWASDGYLHMPARTKVDNASHASYSVSHISSGTHYNFTYGEIEIRAKLPASANMSVMTMLRLIDAECRFDQSPACLDQAISVADLRSVEPSRVFIGVNYGKDRGKSWMHNAQSSLLDGQFHNFKVRWDRDSIHWYVDNLEVRRLTDPRMIPVTPMQISIELDSFRQRHTMNAEAELLVDYIVVRKLTPLTSSESSMSPAGASLISPEDAQWKMWVALVSVVALVFALLGVWCWRRRNPPVSPMRPANALDVYFDIVSNQEDDARRRHIKEMYMAWKVPSLAAGLKIPRKSLRFDKKLDEGEFGEVWKGVAYDLSEWPSPSVVAVKCVKNSADDYQHKLLMDEVTVHSKAGRHLNIVSLLGITLSGQLHIILEFSSHGSLLKYLRLHDKLFQEKTSETSYLNEGMANFTMDGRESSIPKEWPLKTADLINFTYQVSRGMEYLAVHDIIHRDLAARNVLVCDNKVLKICDFGLARQKPDYYRMTESQDARVPARWMAPESYEQRLFSERSDVWSFGVVTWEIFSYGGIPYHDTIKDLVCQHIIAALRNGLRLKIPLKCPKAVDDIMRECWDYEAAKRPTFSVLRQRIEWHVGKDAQCECGFELCSYLKAFVT